MKCFATKKTAVLISELLNSLSLIIAFCSLRQQGFVSVNSVHHSLLVQCHMGLGVLTGIRWAGQNDWFWRQCFASQSWNTSGRRLQPFAAVAWWCQTQPDSLSDRGGQTRGWRFSCRTTCREKQALTGQSTLWICGHLWSSQSGQPEQLINSGGD